jgi:hypothetical protein
MVARALVPPLHASAFCGFRSAGGLSRTPLDWSFLKERGTSAHNVLDQFRYTKCRFWRENLAICRYIESFLLFDCRNRQEMLSAGLSE